MLVSDERIQCALSGNFTALAIRYAYTTFGNVYPSNTENADSVISATPKFIGDDRVSIIYSDNAYELVVAARYLRIPRAASLLGIPQTSGLIEREARGLLMDTRTLVVAVGLPG